MADGALELWDRREAESPEAFEAFRAYRDLGVGRSIRKVAEQLDKSRQLVGRWSADHDWVERAGAWDLEQDRQQREAFKRESVAAGRRQARQAQGFLQVASMLPIEVMTRLDPNSERHDPGLLSKLPADQLLDLTVKFARAFPRLVVAERLARGMSTDNVEHGGSVTVHHERAASMSDDQLRDFLAGDQPAQLPPGDPAGE